MKKYNVMVVSNSINYADQLRRTSIFNDNLNVTQVVKSVNELKNRLSNDIDVYIISDILANNDRIEDVIEVLQSSDALVYAVIKNQSTAQYLDSIGVGYSFEASQTPIQIINFLSESLISLNNDVPSDDSYDNNDDYQQEYEEPVIQEPIQQPIKPKQTQPIQRPRSVERNTNIHKKVEPINQYQEPPKPENIQPIQQRRRPTSSKTTFGIMKNKVVSFTSSKGGVGKSSLSIEVASCLAQRARQVEVNLTNQRGLTDKIDVCLVDLNFAFSTTPSTLDCVINAPKQVTLLDWVISLQEKIINNLDIQTKRNLQSQTYPDYVSEMKKLNRNDLMFTKQEMLNMLVYDETTGLYILPTISSPYDCDSVKREYITVIIEELSRIFDIIVIDTGNNLSHFTSEAYYLSDEIYVVGQPTISVGVILKNLIDEAVNRLGVDKDKFKLVINHPNLSNRGIDIQGMANSLGIPLVANIPYDENMGRAHEAGHYYTVNNRKRKFSYEIALLANQICPLWNIANQPKKSVSRKLFGK